MTKEIASPALLAAFMKVHEEHYSVGAELGEGAAGYTFRARDNRRGVDVCVKLLKSGAASEGSRRDWRITSTIKHPLVGDTFTVEHFGIDSVDSPCSAIVSRYVGGPNLDEFLDALQVMDRRHHEAAEADLAALGADLCRAVAAIHAFGFGHGDLHERNVIVVRPSPDALADEHDPARWQPVVIDFDNATFSASDTRKEEELVESDVRALRRLLGCLTVDTPWHTQIQRVLHEATSATDVGRAFAFVRRVLRRSLYMTDPNHFQEAHWSDVVRGNLVETIAGRSYARAGKHFLREVAEFLGVEGRLQAATDAFEKRVREDKGYPSGSVTTTVRDVAIETALDELAKGK